jgi:hypothetical protein
MTRVDQNNGIGRLWNFGANWLNFPELAKYTLASEILFLLA